MRVLMLGFEFPPRLSGGLGTACQGLARALTGAGTEVLFVLPRLSGEERAGDAELVAADAIELPDDEPSAPPTPTLASIEIESPLQPYFDEVAYRARVAELRERAAAVPPEERVFRSPYGSDLGEEVVRYARAVAEIVRHEAFAVIHAHDWMSFPAGILAKEVTGRPLVCHVHSTEHDRRPLGSGRPGPDPRIVDIERQGLEAADRIVCVSRRSADEVCERYGVPFAKVRVVHNGIDPAPVRAPEAPENAEVADAAAPTVLFLGRLTRQKGPEHFLEAAAAVSARAPEVRFRVAGEGELLPELVELAEELGLTDKVEFTGFVEGEEREAAFRAATIYVMPSVAEPFGLAPLEAMARDVPVIVSRQAGVAEVAGSVLKVDYQDTAALAERILALLRRPALRDELVAQGRAEVERLGWNGPAQRLTGIYEEVVS